MNLKNFLICFIVFFSFALNAQIMEGTKYLGGSLGFNSSKAKSDNAEAITDWSVSPEVGYFFMDNMAAGLRLSLNGSSSGDDFSSGGFAGLVYVRKFWNASDNFHLFGGLNVGYGTNNVSVGSFDSSENIFGAALDFGIWYNITDKWSVAGTLGNLGFSTISNPDDDQDGETGFGLNVNTTTAPFSLGVYYGF
jgi:hypothetical protein